MITTLALKSNLRRVEATGRRGCYLQMRFDEGASASQHAHMYLSGEV
jgi:hypothetical protein